MKKTKLGPETLLYPMPAVLVGALVYSTGTQQYHHLGKPVAKAFSVGKK